MGEIRLRRKLDPNFIYVQVPEREKLLKLTAGKTAGIFVQDFCSQGFRGYGSLLRVAVVCVRG